MSIFENINGKLGNGKLGLGSLVRRAPEAQAPVVHRYEKRKKIALPEATPIEAVDLQDLLKKEVTVLTGGPDAEVQIPSNTQSFVCLLADGTLLVSRNHTHHAIIGELLEIIDQRNLRLSVVHHVGIEDIQNFYDRGRRLAVGESDLERMQKDVLALFEEASDQGATDIKIDLVNGRGVVRFCINDDWRDHVEWDKDYTKLLLTAAYNMCPIGDGTYKEGEFQASRLSSREGAALPRNIESVRMQMGPRAGEGGRYLVARLLPSRLGAGAKKTLHDLGYDAEHMTMLKQIRDTPFGVILMTGPTGSGKSTTLACSMEERYRELDGRQNIMTVEDPAEYEIRGATQLEIANVTTEEERSAAYTKAFNSLLRSKPHIIMIGEVRDLPAAKFLIKASQSGHQCWSSLHTKNALTIPVRLKEMGVEPYLVKDSSIIVGGVFQRLVPKICPHCALPFDMSKASDEIRNMVGIICEGDVSGIRVRNPVGCGKCRTSVRANPGYAGQTVVAEILQPDDEILAACIEGRRQEAIERWLCDANAMTAYEHGLRKIVRGILDPNDVYLRVHDRADLQRLQRDPSRVQFVREGRSKPLPLVEAFPIDRRTPPRLQQMSEIADQVVDHTPRRNEAVIGRPKIELPRLRERLAASRGAPRPDGIEGETVTYRRDR